VEQLSRADRAAQGKDARAVAPLESHGEFSPGRGRDPVGLLLGQAESRVPELVPVRHGRMLVSPFTFYRGAALPMAADLAGTPASGLRVQLCGDAHLSNFGAFASPERNLVFDVNDFDETLPGPFEWDVKRLAASLAVAGRDSGFPAKVRRKITLAAGAGYRTAMQGFAVQPFLDVWYTHVDIEPVLAQFRSQMKEKGFKTAQKLLAKAHSSDSTKALDKLTTMVDGRRQFISTPPTIVPVEEVFPGLQADAIYEQIRARWARRRSSFRIGGTCSPSSSPVQLARKVVVGSVAPRPVLPMTPPTVEPPPPCRREAQAPVLAEMPGAAGHQPGRRVAGQHLMQPKAATSSGLTPSPTPKTVARDSTSAADDGSSRCGSQMRDAPGGPDVVRPVVRVDFPGRSPLRDRIALAVTRRVDTFSGHRRPFAGNPATTVNELDYAARQVRRRAACAEAATGICAQRLRDRLQVRAPAFSTGPGP
jgi:hypothetical protein